MQSQRSLELVDEVEPQQLHQRIVDQKTDGFSPSFKVLMRRESIDEMGILRKEIYKVS